MLHRRFDQDDQDGPTEDLEADEDADEVSDMSDDQGHEQGKLAAAAVRGQGLTGHGEGVGRGLGRGRADAAAAAAKLPTAERKAFWEGLEKGQATNRYAATACFLLTSFAAGTLSLTAPAAGECCALPAAEAAGRL